MRELYAGIISGIVAVAMALVTFWWLLAYTVLGLADMLVATAVIYLYTLCRCYLALRKERR